MCASVHVECQQTTLAWGRFSCALLCMLISLTLELLGFFCLCSSHCGGARITDVLQQLPSWGLNSDSYAFLRSSFRTEPISLAPPKPVYFDGQRLPAVPPMNFSVFPEEINTWRGSVIYPSHKSTDVETADPVCNFLYIGLAWDFSLQLERSQWVWMHPPDEFHPQLVLNDWAEFSISCTTEFLMGVVTVKTLAFSHWWGFALLFCFCFCFVLFCFVTGSHVAQALLEFTMCPKLTWTPDLCVCTMPAYGQFFKVPP